MASLTVLGIETSSPVTSVVAWRDGAPAGRAISEGARDHVEFLMPAILRLTELREVGAIAVGIGPGLFTSMRVGIATAKMLAVTLDIPIVGICSLDALARPVMGEAAVVVACVDAHRGEVYAARYEAGRRIAEPRALAPDALVTELPPEALLVGNGPARYPDVLGAFAARDAVPDAHDVVVLALPRLEKGDADDARALEPLYVRRSDAEIKWDERGVKIERPMRVRYPGQDR